MRFSVSNIAWSPDERLEAYSILKKHGATGLEIAPGLFFHSAEDAFMPTDEEARGAIAEISEAGLELVSMQSLLFGVEGAAIFEGDTALNTFQNGMKRAINLAGRFGIPNLVFGSPKQRVVPDDMEMRDAENLAVDVFRKLGEYAAAADTDIAIEFNPSDYGTNFLNNIEQAHDFVEQVNHSSVTLNLDMGAMYMNGQFDEIETWIKKSARLISHVHISEPNLNPAPASEENTNRVLKALNDIGYERWVSIEMKPDPGHNMATLDQCISRLMKSADLN